MSSDRPNDGHLSAADDPSSDSEVAELVRLRGAPLLEALEARVPTSREQTEAAAAYAFAAAVELGLDRAGAELMREVAKLHRVGLLYVPAEILAKPASGRTPDERTLVEAHHESGAQLARGAGIPESACEWIRLGAERYDGEGPGGLCGEAIPLPARIARAAYACHAHLAADPDVDAAQAVRESSGRELDPVVVDALVAVLADAGSG